MTRLFAIAALIAGLASAQPRPEPKFALADVHGSAKASIDYPSSAFLHAGRFEFRHATMVELISYAWDVAGDKVLGGPSWLEMDKFDILANTPPGAKTDDARLMLRSLLAERFGLEVRNDTQPVPAYVLTAGKKPLLREAAAADDSGCKFNVEGAGNERGASTDGGSPPPPRVVTLAYTCHNVSMAKFAELLPDMNGASQFIGDYPVIDRTGLQGAWDFTFKDSDRGARANAPGAEFITLFDALDKQLGLKLEPGKVPQPVLVVVSVNETPTPDSPEAKKAFPDTPLEFEVADIKPGDPDNVRGAHLNVQPGGRVNIQGLPLKFLIEQLWNLSDDMVIGAPKFMDDQKWDIVAKAPAVISDGPDIDFDSLFGMLKTLMAERFGFRFHMEERAVSSYTLLAGKPKMKKADPALRTHCIEGPPLLSKTDPRDSNPVLGRLLTCQNTSMTQFADQLMDLANGYIHSPVLDSTGLQGGWDFTLSFSPAGQLRGGGAPPKSSPGAQDLADPNGAVSLGDAIAKQLGLKLELQKRPVEVMVIDHIDEKPSDN